MEDSGSGFSADTQQRYFYSGIGPAAVNAAETIRKRDATGNILILSEEEVLPYNRPMLTKNMFSEPQQDKLRSTIKNGMRREIFSCFWAEEWSPSIPKQKEIKTEDGLTFSYDKCIYTLGAHFSFRLSAGVMQKTSQESGPSPILKNCPLTEVPARKAGVIGGSVTGLEAAWELKKAGFDTYVFDSAPSLMANKLDPTASALLMEIFESEGVHIVTSADTEACEDGKVKLKDGREYEADLVIVSCGGRANKAVARKLRASKQIVRLS